MPPVPERRPSRVDPSKRQQLIDAKKAHCRGASGEHPPAGAHVEAVVASGGGKGAPPPTPKPVLSVPLSKRPGAPAPGAKPGVCVPGSGTMDAAEEKQRLQCEARVLRDACKTARTDFARLNNQLDHERWVGVGGGGGGCGCVWCGCVRV